jgi:hypothetical protein
VLFGLVRKKRSERVAEFDLTAEVAPVRPEDAPDASGLLVMGDVPDFVAAADADSITVRLPDGQRLHEMLAAPGAAQAPLQRRLTAQEIGQLFSLMADWNRGELAATPHSYIAREGDNSDVLLRETARGVQSLLLNMQAYAGGAALPGQELALPSQPAIVDVGSLRSALSRQIGEGYASHAYGELALRMRASLDRHGNIAAKPFEKGTRRYDIVGKLQYGNNQPIFRFGLHVPDLLSDGPFYAAVLRRSGEEATAREFLDELHDARLFPRDVPGLAQWLQFVNQASAEEPTRVIRIERHKSGNDRNLLFLGGNLGGIATILGFRHQIAIANRGEPDAEFEVERLEKPELVLSKLGQQPWRAHNSLASGGNASQELQTYFAELFCALRAWKLWFV